MRPAQRHEQHATAFCPPPTPELTHEFEFTQLGHRQTEVGRTNDAAQGLRLAPIRNRQSHTSIVCGVKVQQTLSWSNPKQTSQAPVVPALGRWCQCSSLLLRTKTFPKMWPWVHIYIITTPAMYLQLSEEGGVRPKTHDKNSTFERTTAKDLKNKFQDKNRAPL